MVRFSAPESIERKEADSFLVPPYSIQIDHRERRGGWRFADFRAGSKEKYARLLVKTEEVHLKTGDYAATDEDGNRLPILIERKSGDDLIGSITNGRDRFKAEHERMQDLIESLGYFCCVVIEASLADLISEVDSPGYPRKVSSNQLMSMAASWPQRFGVPWFFCGNPVSAERYCLSLIQKAYERTKHGEV